MQFSELLCCHRAEKIGTWLHGWPAKFADRKIARILKSFQSSYNFSEAVAFPAKDIMHRNL